MSHPDERERRAAATAYGLREGIGVVLQHETVVGTTADNHMAIAARDDELVTEECGQVCDGQAGYYVYEENVETRIVRTWRLILKVDDLQERSSR